MTQNIFLKAIIFLKPPNKGHRHQLPNMPAPPALQASGETEQGPARRSDENDHPDIVSRASNSVENLNNVD